MIGVVDPATVLELLGADVPAALHGNLLLTGSLAAAYHYRDGAHPTVLTKDADVVVRPAGAVDECREIATRLLSTGWRPEEGTRPGAANDPDENLRVIRLYPPEHEVYFVEFLGMPHVGQRTSKEWVRVELKGTIHDGWYVVPCFRYMALFATDVRTSKVGSSYASPPLMALANLLSHPTIGTATIANTGLLRSAKDLGRVLSLARLASAGELEAWPTTWWSALREHFGTEAEELARRVGDGVHALLEDGEALNQAYDLAVNGLLTGRNVTSRNFEILAERLLAITIQDLHRLARR